eukprot:1066912-Alexandrium_andersonii.AAC.1
MEEGLWPLRLLFDVPEELAEALEGGLGEEGELFGAPAVQAFGLVDAGRQSRRGGSSPCRPASSTG